MNSLSNTDKPTINVSYNFKFVDCNKKCESSPKIGKSWYKQFGYNSACQCLEAKVILNTMIYLVIMMENMIVVVQQNMSLIVI